MIDNWGEMIDDDVSQRDGRVTALRCIGIGMWHYLVVLACAAGVVRDYPEVRSRALAGPGLARIGQPEPAWHETACSRPSGADTVREQGAGRW